MTEDRISAGELRASGTRIPDDVPDCATVPRHAIKIDVLSTSFTSDHRMIVDANVTITEPFEWIDLSVTITKDGTARHRNR